MHPNSASGSPSQRHPVWRRNLESLKNSAMNLFSSDVPKCEHPSCSNPTNGYYYCSEWCSRNAEVLYHQSTGKTNYDRKGYTCLFPKCERHRGVQQDGRLYRYCSRDCHTKVEELSQQQAKDRQTLASRAQQQQHHQQQHHSTSWNDDILFYEKDQDYYEFTNFFMCDIIIDEQKWASTEHYFQAQKFVGTPYLAIIRDLHTPREAFEKSRQPEVSRWKRGDWEDVKQEIMYTALLAKFSHDNLRQKLANTGDRELIENSPYDSYWGVGSNGKGSNHLGKLLMDVRDLILKTPRIRPSETSVDRKSPPSSSTPLCTPTPSNTDSTMSDQPTSAEQKGAVANCCDSSKEVDSSSSSAHNPNHHEQTDQSSPNSNTNGSASAELCLLDQQRRKGDASSHLNAPKLMEQAYLSSPGPDTDGSAIAERSQQDQQSCKLAESSHQNAPKPLEKADLSSPEPDTVGCCNTEQIQQDQPNGTSGDDCPPPLVKDPVTTCLDPAEPSVTESVPNSGVSQSLLVEDGSVGKIQTPQVQTVVRAAENEDNSDNNGSRNKSLESEVQQLADSLSGLKV